LVKKQDTITVEYHRKLTVFDNFIEDGAEQQQTKKGKK